MLSSDIYWILPSQEEFPPQFFSASSFHGVTENGGFGHRLETTPHDSTNDRDADFEKVYWILRKFHASVQKLEHALQDSGVVLRSCLPEQVLSRILSAHENYRTCNLRALS